MTGSKPWRINGVHEGCGFGPCKHSKDRGGHGCDMCDRVAKIAPLEACGRQVSDGVTCSLFKGHPSWVACRGTKKARERAAVNAARDGDRPDKDAAPLAFKKRTRVGPHR